MAQKADPTIPPALPVIAGDSCHTAVDTARFRIKVAPKGLYSAAKGVVRLHRDSLAARFGREGKSDSLYRAAAVIVEENIVNRLIPFWYGTPWDFNGHISVPQTGAIACGYFVSTILEHCGFVVNRYQLAQQRPYLEARTIQMDDSVQVYRTAYERFSKAFVRKNKEGLYFVGLDCHVGFLLYRAGDLLFIHSSYIDPLCVIVERAAASPAFNATSTYVVAQLSHNRKLIDAWIAGGRIEVKTE
jgi:hypothetical protein